MKILAKLLVLMAAFAVGSNHLMAQWIQTGGPKGGQVNCFVHFNDYLFAGISGGVFC
jgi:hypothetical protein